MVKVTRPVSPTSSSISETEAVFSRPIVHPGARTSSTSFQMSRLVTSQGSCSPPPPAVEKKDSGSTGSSSGPTRADAEGSSGPSFGLSSADAENASPLSSASPVPEAREESKGKAMNRASRTTSSVLAAQFHFLPFIYHPPLPFLLACHIALRRLFSRVPPRTLPCSRPLSPEGVIPYDEPHPPAFRGTGPDLHLLCKPSTGCIPWPSPVGSDQKTGLLTKRPVSLLAPGGR